MFNLQSVLTSTSSVEQVTAKKKLINRHHTTEKYDFKRTLAETSV
jgi:hypothetical protein